MGNPTVDVRMRRSGQKLELFLVARPGPWHGSAEVFRQVAATLQHFSARIFHERIFAQTEDLQRLAAERAASYGALDDGVHPTWLSSPAGHHGPLAAVLIHAIAGIDTLTAVGNHLRVLHANGASMLALSALEPSPADLRENTFSAQAAAVFAEAGTLLRQNDSSLAHLARTWLWVDPIHRHYGDLNRGRTKSFVDHGLILPDGLPVYLPASTGIGLKARSGSLSLEGVASANGSRPVMWLGSGNQNSALNYGSAFSRASRLRTPTGETVYVSGTASIDRTGATVAVGDEEGQVHETVKNVRAVLNDIGLSESDIVHGVAYVTSAAVAATWRGLGITWPMAEVRADICRPDLLFEIEVTACPGARHG